RLRYPASLFGAVRQRPPPGLRDPHSRDLDVGWHGLARARIRYPLLANAVQRLLTAMVGQDREEANRLQQAKWDLTSRIGMKVTFRTHSISPGDHRSSRGSGPAVPD